jgi:hypothetical protein
MSLNRNIILKEWTSSVGTGKAQAIDGTLVIIK